jgi:hypothetical protein
MRFSAMTISKVHLSDAGLVKKVVQTYVSKQKPTLRELAEQFSISYHTAMEMVRQTLPKEQIIREKQLRYSRGKVGLKNPMFGKTTTQHPNYKGLIGDGKGYFLVLRPPWFTSRPGSKHVFFHHVVFCQAAGMTGVPAGFTVHHIDGNPANNDIHNLTLVTTRGHARIHYPKSEKFTLWEKHVSGISKSKRTTAMWQEELSTTTA